MRFLPSRVLWSGMVLSLAVAPAFAAQGSWLEDAGFDAYREDRPGPWEFRYGHKGGRYPKARPLWRGVSRTDKAKADIGRYLSIEKRVKSGAGTVLVGQRVTLPKPLPRLALGIVYQCYCSGSNRSGIVSLGVFSPKLWDSLPRRPEVATRAAPKGDIFHQTIRSQGEDVTRWTPGRASSARLRAALARYAGAQVVVAAAFTTWHEGSTEWAKFDALWLGPPLPHIDIAGWPRYAYRGEPVSLRVDAFSRDPDARVVLEYRAAGSAGPWRQAPMKPAAAGLYAGDIPGEAASAPLEARARVLSRQDAGLETEVKTIQLTQRPDHPSLFYSKAELARMREKVQQYDWAKAVAQSIQRNADRWLKQDFKPQVISGYWWHHYNCKDCGSRLSMQGPHRHVCRHCHKVWDNDILYHVYWSKVHGDHARAARDLALTYQMTGEKKYARRAIEFLTWYADHYAEFPPADKGGKVVSQTLDECGWLLRMMEAADLAYPAMTKEEARHIEQDLIYAGAMYTRKYRGGIHNIRCWHNSCWAAAGYFVGDPELVAFARGGPYGFVSQMQKGVLPDGMWYERSMGYHSYTVSAITYQLKAALHAGDDLYKMPQVHKLLVFPLMITFPNLVTPSLNDGGFSSRPISPHTLELAAAWYDDPAAVSALRKRYSMGARRTSMEAWQFGEELPKAGPYTPPPSMDLKGAGLAVLRRGQGKNAVCAMVEYGEHGGGHGHPDKLQLILYGLGRQLCPDLGTTGYANPLHSRYYKTTPGHNTVTIGGRNMAGKGGQLLAFVANDRYSAAAVRTDEVYSGYVLTRRVLLGDGFLVDEFVVEGKKADTLDWILRSEGELALGLETRGVKEDPLSAPYRYFTNLRGAQTDRDWTATWAVGRPKAGAPAPRLVVTLKGEPGTQVVAADAPGPAGWAQMWGTLRVRRRSAQSRFVAVHQLVPAGNEPARVSFEGRSVRVGPAVVDLANDDAAAPTMK